MSQPAETPDWATNGPGVADITDPSTAKKQSGWVVEKPAHDVFNWWMYTVWLWIIYLKNLAGEVFTWTAAHTFNARVTFNGDGTDSVAVGVINTAPSHSTLFVGNSGGGPAISAGQGGAAVDSTGLNNGTYISPLRFGSLTSGEGITSARSGGTNVFGLDFWTASAARLRITNGGTVQVVNPDALSAPVTMNTVSSFSGGWSGVSGGIKPSYWKTADGTVHVTGKFYRSAGAIGSDTLCTIPAGFRPQSTVSAAAAGNSTACVASINSGGSLTFGSYGGGTNQFVDVSLSFNVNTVNGP